MQPEVEAILDFWHGLGPAGWYAVDPEVDQAITARFGPLWQQARAGRLRDWPDTPEGALAFLILTDQFPRNMFRGQGLAFATDALALAAARRAIAAGQDLQIAGAARQFFYLPFMHSEDLDDQQDCLRLFDTRMPDSDNRRHARAHRDVIARFGRFPYRNAALGRETSPEEQDFLDRGGYPAALRDVDAAG